MIFTEPSCSSNNRKNYPLTYDSCNNKLETNYCTDRIMYPTFDKCKNIKDINCHNNPKNYSINNEHFNNNCEQNCCNNCQNHQELTEISNDNLKANDECKCGFKGKF